MNGQGSTADVGSSSGSMLATPDIDLGLSEGVMELSVGYSHACVISNNHVLKCWGHCNQAQCGNPLKAGAPVGDGAGEMGANLIAIDLGAGVIPVKVACGTEFTCVLTLDGRVKCFGRNESGQLGQGSTTSPIGDVSGEMGDNLPYTNLGTGRTVKKLFVHQDHSCAILDDDSLKCWGYSEKGELGQGANSNIGASGTMGDSLPAINLGVGMYAVDAALGRRHTCALLNDATVRCWGLGTSLGIDAATDRGDGSSEMGENLPRVILSGSVVSIHAGEFVTCAIFTNHSATCWGSPGQGQMLTGSTSILGDSSGEMAALPLLDLGSNMYNIASISLFQVGCALYSPTATPPGRVICWGNGAEGRRGIDTTASYGASGGETSVSGQASVIIRPYTYTTGAPVSPTPPTSAGMAPSQAPVTAGEYYYNGAKTPSDIGSDTDFGKYVSFDEAGVWGHVVGSSGMWQFSVSGTTATFQTKVTSRSGVYIGGLRESDGASLSTASSATTWYVYSRSGSTWTQAVTGTFPSSYEICDSNRGTSVIYCLVAGTGVIHERTYSSGWTAGAVETITQPPSTSIDGARVGGNIVVSYNEDYMAVKANHYGNEFVHIYVQSGGTWSFQQSIKGSGATLEGVSTGLEGTALAFNQGATLLASGRTQDSNYNGAFFMWSRTGTVWTQVGSKHTSPGNKLYGAAIAFLDSRLFVGAANGMPGGKDFISIDVFGYDASGTVSFIKTLTSDPYTGTKLRFAFGGTMLMVGASGGSGAYSNTGKLFMFSKVSANTASPTPAPTGVKKVVTVSTTTCVLMAIGQLRCFGDNTNGMLGQGSTASIGGAAGSMTYLQNIDLAFSEVVDMCVGLNYVCAVSSAGQVKCWGGNEFGQLGQGHTNALGDGPGEMGSNLPVVDLGTGQLATQISCMQSHTCVLLQNRQVKCWGYGDSGRLGYGNANNLGDGGSEMGNSLAYVDLGTGMTALQVEAGLSHTCVRLYNSQVKCWGKNDLGQLGKGNVNSLGDGAGEMGDSLTAIDFGSGALASSISAGSEMTCAILDTGNMKCWGAGGSGRLGLDSTTNRGDGASEMGTNLPNVILGGAAVKQVSAKGLGACVVLSADNSVRCWGDNSGTSAGSAMMGTVTDIGTTSGHMASLVALEFGTYKFRIIQVAHGAISCAVYVDHLTTESGAKETIGDGVVCWGLNTVGQRGIESTTQYGGTAGQVGGQIGTVLTPVILPVTPSTYNPTQSPTESIYYYYSNPIPASQTANNEMGLDVFVSSSALHGLVMGPSEAYPFALTVPDTITFLTKQTGSRYTAGGGINGNSLEIVNTRTQGDRYSYSKSGSGVSSTWTLDSSSFTEGNGFRYCAVPWIFTKMFCSTGTGVLQERSYNSHTWTTTGGGTFPSATTNPGGGAPSFDTFVVSSDDGLYIASAASNSEAVYIYNQTTVGAAVTYVGHVQGSGYVGAGPVTYPEGTGMAFTSSASGTNYLVSCRPSDDTNKGACWVHGEGGGGIWGQVGPKYTMPGSTYFGASVQIGDDNRVFIAAPNGQAGGGTSFELHIFKLDLVTGLMTFKQTITTGVAFTAPRARCMYAASRVFCGTSVPGGNGKLYYFSKNSP